MCIDRLDLHSHRQTQTQFPNPKYEMCYAADTTLKIKLYNEFSSSSFKGKAN